VEWLELAQGEGELAMADEAQSLLKALQHRAEALELELLFNAEEDDRSALLELHAGAGGTDSCDWAAMLRRMYTMWSERQGYAVKAIAEQPGSEAGLRSAVLRIDGPFAFGWLAKETGVHRLVRLSPFDSNSRRHTSFAAVTVLPVVKNEEEIPILSKDLRIETFRASGAGGQHVNTTDSAVRITHLPTGIVANSQAERSQHRNRASAMLQLQARLLQRKLAARAQEKAKFAASLGDNAWSNHIRSYVLQPYQQVKDLRTGVSTADATGVLNGDLDAFVKACIKTG